MAIDKLNPFMSNPFAGAGVKPASTGAGVQAPSFGGVTASENKGQLFQGFQVPESNGAQNSFMKQGPLGDDAMYGYNGARLGGNLNVFA